MFRTLLLLLYDTVLICLAIEDYKYQKIRNGYVKIILLLALISMFVIPEITVKSKMAGMFAVSIPMMIIRRICLGGFGGGDVKLAFASGLFLGWKLLLKGTAASIFLAGGYSLWIFLSKSQTRQFALGPFLSAGYVLMTIILFLETVS